MLERGFLLAALWPLSGRGFNQWQAYAGRMTSSALAASFGRTERLVRAGFYQGSVHLLAATDIDGFSGDKAGLIGSEKSAERCGVFDLTNPPRRDTRGHFFKVGGFSHTLEG